MNISRFHFNTILIGLLALSTLALALLYLTQPAIQLTNPGTYSTYQEIDQKISTLETMITIEQVQAEKQKNEQENNILQLNTLLAERTTELAASEERTQKMRSLLIAEQDITRQLNIQLDKEKARVLDQETNLTSSSAKMLMLNKSLKQEKDYSLRLKSEFEAEKLHFLAVQEELDLKKRELVRYKRELKKTTRALSVKKRDLTISQVQVNDIKRKNDLLNEKVLILNGGPGNVRQSSQKHMLVGSPNS